VQPARPGQEERLKQLEERIDALFKEIVKLAEDRQVEELIVKFTELRQVMNEFGSSGTDRGAQEAREVEPAAVRAR
jgi:hypothetical protein